MSPAKSYGFITRMFLRDCAFLMKLYRRSDSRWVWTYATLSLSITLASCTLLALTAIAMAFPTAFPAQLHPTTAPKHIILMEGAAIYALVGFCVDYFLRDFRTDVSAASDYMNRSDLLKWWLATLLTGGCMIGIGLLVAASGEGYL